MNEGKNFYLLDEVLKSIFIFVGGVLSFVAAFRFQIQKLFLGNFVHRRIKSWTAGELKCGAALNRQPGFRARNLQRRGKLEMRKKAKKNKK